MDDDTGELLGIVRGTKENSRQIPDRDGLPQLENVSVRGESPVRPRTILPLSMRIMKQMSFGVYCTECTPNKHVVTTKSGDDDQSEEMLGNEEIPNISLADYVELDSDRLKSSSASPHVLAPMFFGGVSGPKEQRILETIMSEYVRACQFYACSDRINAGILTTIRFSLPSMRVRGSFHDTDMLALAEILLRYANGPLSYIKRLDFSVVATKAATAKNVGRTPGFSSHGALTLSKVLQSTRNINEVLLEENRVGPYGATAVFIACSQNSTIQRLGMRGCRIGERGAYTFVEFVCQSYECGLRSVDLSCNQMGYTGSVAIEMAMMERQKKPDLEALTINIEGNLVFQEVMNSVTHGLGVALSLLGSYLLWNRVEGQSRRHIVSCTIYSISLVTLYTISTLFHSFFGLIYTRWLFQVMDKCAIYILIAGSYTPFLQIALWHRPVWSVYLLGFLWFCCVTGIFAEFAFPQWPYLGRFSLSMYLAMGWSALICLPEVASTIPESMSLIILGGVFYTGGVPFFVRSNNLDHAIWHLFVLAGSITHWIGIYTYVATIVIPENA